jgi:hypothetical protein
MQNYAGSISSGKRWRRKLAAASWWFLLAMMTAAVWAYLVGRVYWPAWGMLMERPASATTRNTRGRG